MAALRIARPRPEHIARGVNLALVAALSISLAQLTWRVLPAPQLPAPSAAVQAATTERRQAPNSLDKVAQLHLLGEAGRAAQVAQPRPVDAPETRLNLVLRGVFAADEPGAGAAIIAEGGNNEAFYRTGASVPGGAVLREIYPDRVILERGGRYETLRLPEDSKAGMSLGRADRVSATRPAIAPRAGDVTHARLPELAGYREEIQRNPARAFDLVSLQPVMDGGGLKGYRVGPGKDRELFRRSGLRPGDVVTGINGTPLDDPARLNDVFRELTSATELSLTVERGGGSRNIVVSVQ